MTVAELLQVVMPRLSSAPQSIAFIDAVQTLQDMIARRLWTRRSDLLKTAWTSAEIAAGAETVMLPSGFLGLVEQPYIDGQTAILTPLPENTRQYFTETGTPRHYELVGRSMSLFPPPAEAIVLKGVYFGAPQAITDMSDELPFDGLFDSVFQDAIPHVASRGIFIGSDKAFAITVNNYVDSVLCLRGSRRPQWRYPA